MDYIKAIDIVSDARGQYKLRWGDRFTAAPVAISIADSPTTVRQTPPVLHAADNSGTDIRLTPGVRHYFYLKPVDAPGLIVAERRVPVEGSVNFRDLGGYLTDDGRRVRWGKLYRSGHMANLTAEGLAQFAALNIARDCDFRLAEERAHEAADLPAGTAVTTLGIPPGVGDREYFHRIFASTTDPKVVFNAVCAVVRSMVTDAAPKYKPMFEHLQDTPSGAMLLNCSAGKERTGIAAALILFALGVPRETVTYDFMLSRRYFPAESEIPRVVAKYNVSAANAPALVAPLLETHPQYLESALTVIDEQYGTPAAFLQHHYGLTPQALATLRDAYTE